MIHDNSLSHGGKWVMLFLSGPQKQTREMSHLFRSSLSPIEKIYNLPKYFHLFSPSLQTVIWIHCTPKVKKTTTEDLLLTQLLTVTTTLHGYNVSPLQTNACVCSQTTVSVVTPYFPFLFRKLSPCSTTLSCLCYANACRAVDEYLCFPDQWKNVCNVNVICLYLSVGGHNQTIFSWRLQRFRSSEENFNVCWNDTGFQSHSGYHKDRYVLPLQRTILLEHSVSFKVKKKKLFSSGIERSCCALCRQQKARSENICYFSHSRPKEENNTKSPCIRTRIKFFFKVRNHTLVSCSY